MKAHTPPLRYKQIERVSAPQFNNKLTFEHVLDALCDHFMYSSSQRAALLNSKSYREYRHAKYMLVHLLLVDLKVTQEEASELVQCARRTISTVCQHVRSNKLQFEHDLKRIRELYPKETKNDS